MLNVRRLTVRRQHIVGQRALADIMSANQLMVSKIEKAEENVSTKTL